MKKHFLGIVTSFFLSINSSPPDLFSDYTCTNEICNNLYYESLNIASEYDGWADRTLSSMTLEEKIGQLFFVSAISDPDLLNPDHQEFYEEAVKYADLSCSWDQYGNSKQIEELIKQYHVGGIIFLGQKGRLKSYIRLANHFRNLSKYPLAIAQDFETTLNPPFDDMVNFPQAMTLGALTNNSLLYSLGREIGQQSKRIGTDIVLGPVVDVHTNYRNPIISSRSFGDNKDSVVAKATAYMQGIQSAGIIATAKHFPGHGDTEVDPHWDLPRITKSLQELESVELYPFKKVIEAGVLAIMTAHLEVPALEPQEHLPSTLSSAIVTDLLKKKMGFTGLVITDALIMSGVTKHHKPGQIELKALQAGHDILLCPTNVPLAFTNIKQALLAGTLLETDLDKHVMRILKAKEWLLKRGGCTATVDQPSSTTLVSREAIALRDQLYAEALTMCKSDSDLDGPKTYQSILFIGNKASGTFDRIISDNIPYRANTLKFTHLTEEDEEEILDIVECDTDLLISMYDIDPYKAYFGIEPNILKLINKLRRDGKKLTIVLFDDPHALKLFSVLDTVFIAYSKSVPAQKAAAEVILGLRQAQGVLPMADLRKRNIHFFKDNCFFR